MSFFLIMAFLFFIGSLFGWVLELFFRRFISHNNPERKWINPGFLVGPYVPLYGFGLCLLCILAAIPVPFFDRGTFGVFLRLILMGAAMTVIELIAGIFIEKLGHVKLWDYSHEKLNYRGIICPKFSVAWALLGCVYYFCVHPYILNALHWLSENLAFSFFIGLFFGVFIIDVAYSTQLLVKIRKYADEYNVLVRYEELKEHIRLSRVKNEEKARFIFAFKSGTALTEQLKKYADNVENRFAYLRRR